MTVTVPRRVGSARFPNIDRAWIKPVLAAPAAAVRLTMISSHRRPLGCGWTPGVSTTPGRRIMAPGPMRTSYRGHPGTAHQDRNHARRSIEEIADVAMAPSGSPAKRRGHSFLGRRHATRKSPGPPRSTAPRGGGIGVSLNLWESRHCVSDRDAVVPPLRGTTNSRTATTREGTNPSRSVCTPAIQTDL